MIESHITLAIDRGRMAQIEIEEVNSCEALPLLSLNHVSLLCRSVWDSTRFYEEVLGFVLIKRPSSFNFNGAWFAFLTLSARARV